jgi:RNA polymerase sigma-70 factor (ECF subfamily)
MSGGEPSVSLTRPVVYCLVPRELAAQAHEPLARHFRGDPIVEVVVERRGAERRATGDRREATLDERAAGYDQRLIRSAGGRRVGERRAMLVPVATPDLPRRIRPLTDRLMFVERLEPRTVDREDADTARLVTRIQAGEGELFELLYLRYFNRVYSSLRLGLRDPHEAEDVTQQVFVNVLAALPRYELRGQPFRAWLFTIVRNQLMSSLRRRQRSEPADSDELTARLDADAPDNAEDLHALSWISDPELLLFIERLPLPQQQVLLLRFGLDFSHAQIAEILGRSPSNVRALQSRAQHFLRHRLAALEPRLARRYDRPVLRCRKQALVLRSRRWALSRR